MTLTDAPASALTRAQIVHLSRAICLFRSIGINPNPLRCIWNDELAAHERRRLLRIADVRMSWPRGASSRFDDFTSNEQAELTAAYAQLAQVRS